MPPLIEEPILVPGVTPSPIRPRPDPKVTPPDFSRTPPDVALYIETARDSNEWAIAPDVLDWSGIEMRLDGEDSKATIVVQALDVKKLAAGGELGEQHLTHLLNLLHPDKRIRIAMSRGADPPVILFQGYPQTRQASWSDRHQAITVSAIFEPQEIMRTHDYVQVLGRRRRLNPSVEQTDDLATDLLTVLSQSAHFNPDNKPNRLANSVAFQGDEFYVFDDDEAEDAEAWNFADALRYLIVLYAEFESLHVSVADFLWDTIDLVGKPPAPTSADPFLRKMLEHVQSVSIASMSVDASLAALCHAGHLHFHYEIRVPSGDDPSTITPEYHLRVFASLENETEEAATPSGDRRMGSPKVHDITRDAPFTDYTGLTPADIAGRNEARKADLSIDTRAVTAPIFLGGAWDYQVTVLLRPGWLPYDQADNVTDVNAGWDFWDTEFSWNDAVGEAVRDPDTNEVLYWKSIFHPKHPDFLYTADILRKWVFPDDFSYMAADLQTSPYARTSGPWSDPALYNPYYSVEGPPVPIWVDGPLGGSIEDAKNWAPRPRPFGDTIGRKNFATTARNPIVWMNFHAPNPRTALSLPGWVQLDSGAFRIDTKRAAIWISEDNLLASAALREDPVDRYTSMIRAYIERRFCLAITATVRGDDRLSYAPRPAGSTLTRQRTAIVDTGYERFPFRNRIERPGFALPQPDPKPEFDSTYSVVEDFKKFADAAAKAMAADVVAGTVTVPYITTDVRLGDSFAGCEGMGIHFQSFPEVVCIEYTKGSKESYQTIYHLTDLRDAPDVGTE